MSYFDNDDWQPAEWLSAIERLAPAPAPEQIPASSKILESSSKPISPTSRAALDAVTEMAVQWHWPLPRMVSDERPTIHETILILHHNQNWEPAVASNDGIHYYIVGDRDEYYYDLDSSVVWLPLPPKPEVQA